MDRLIYEIQDEFGKRRKFLADLDLQSDPQNSSSPLTIVQKYWNQQATKVPNYEKNLLRTIAYLNFT